METETVLWLFGSTITILGLILGAIWRHKSEVHKSLFDRLKALEDKQSKFEVKVAETYVSTANMDKVVERLERVLTNGLHEVSASLNSLATQFHEHQLEDRR